MRENEVGWCGCSVEKYGGMCEHYEIGDPGVGRNPLGHRFVEEVCNWCNGGRGEVGIECEWTWIGGLPIKAPVRK